MFSKSATRFACAMALLVGPRLTTVSRPQTITMGAALQRAIARAADQSTLIHASDRNARDRGAPKGIR